MAFSVGNALNDGIDRVTTTVAAVLVVGLTALGTLRAAAAQDILGGLFEWILAELQDPGLRSQLGPQQLEVLQTVEGEIQTYVADLPLALGLSPGLAAGVWVLGYVLVLAVIVLTIEAFAHGWDSPADVEFEGVAWKALNLFVGTILFAILFFFGLLLFVLPGLLLAIFLLFFPAAIAIDGENAFGAFSSSAGVVRENFLGTIALIVVSIVVLILVAVVGSIVGGALPATASEIVGQLFSAVATVFLLAVIARAYVAATAT